MDIDKAIYETVNYLVVHKNKKMTKASKNKEEIDTRQNQWN